MIKSMTSFASSEVTLDNFTVSSEIRTYNNRYLDIILHIPREYFDMENKIKSLVSNRLARGRIEIKLNKRDDSEQAYQYEINNTQADAFYNSLIQLKNRFDLKTAISIDNFLKTGGIIKQIYPERNLDSDWIVIEDCLINALNQIEEMRIKEGNFILNDLVERLKFIENSTSILEIETANISSHYQKKLLNRISILTGDAGEIDPWRIAQEVALIADKSDISEEIIRIKSHTMQFYIIINSKEPAGKKLNFLLQEFNREFNTIGSKIQNADLTHTVIAVKAELEKIREQVQNIE